MKFNVVFKRGMTEVARVGGVRELAPPDATGIEAVNQAMGRTLDPIEALAIIGAEQLLERITGHRVHIEQMR